MTRTDYFRTIETWAKDGDDTESGAFMSKVHRDRFDQYVGSWILAMLGRAGVVEVIEAETPVGEFFWVASDRDDNTIGTLYMY